MSDTDDQRVAVLAAAVAYKEARQHANDCMSGPDTLDAGATVIRACALMHQAHEDLLAAVAAMQAAERAAQEETP